MFLKSLSLKGFKSFADPTTLEFEPGVTVVVGPNGSGKSNVVDAIAWVLGAQGPSVVRSARMDDVIFAGTQKRAALGRAEVTLVIDNSLRRLAIDLNEVSITRTLFRSGESEYAINGTECRLLDVQELLSDTGVGRQQHVVVGQGQLDAVLQARPEDRRAIIEEAAGILKFRRRRERAERRLEASEASLARVQDLLREVNRQLKPLERQANSARRHAELQRELGSLKLFLQGRELSELAGRLAALDAQSGELERGVARRQLELETADERLGSIETELGAERADELAPIVARLEQLRERTRGYLALVQERRRAGAQLAAALEGTDVASELARLSADIYKSETEHRTISSDFEALAEEEGTLLVRQQEAEARDRAALRSAEHAAALGRRRDEVEARVTSATTLQSEQAAALERAATALSTAEGEEQAANADLVEADTAHRAAEDRRHALRGRVEVLELALDEARAKTGIERLSAVDGVIGTLLDVVVVDDDLALAFEAAVEPVLDAVLVEGGEAALAAIGQLRGLPGGGKILPLDRGTSEQQNASSFPPGAESLRAAVHTEDRAISRLLDRLIGDVEVVRGDSFSVIERVLSGPERSFVTPEGDRFSPLGWRVGSSRAGATRAALESARAVALEAERLAQQAESRASAARRALEGARSSAISARRFVDRLSGELSANEAMLARDASELASLDGELAGGDLETFDAGSQEEIAALGSALRERRRELERRIAAVDERRSMLQERKRGLEGRLGGRKRTDPDSSVPVVEDAELEALVGKLSLLERRLDDGVENAAVERDRRIEASRVRLERLGASRRAREEIDRALNSDRERHQRVEIERAEARIRHESAIDQLRRDFDVTVDEALAAPAPELPAGVDAITHAHALERELTALGLVNPLAAEELAALEERRFFLDGQLEDVRSARRELNQVIAAIDKEIVEVFTTAYADVERNFAELIAMLFPGGSGRLELVEPEDLLSTGVEIEVNPAGRRVRRLSLLSGGERSLAALGFLFAVFRSRPSPFYVLDEVEAALDDVNLGRFLSLVDEFRPEAQLLIVSHQKRTMEIADALYGISLQPGGATKVVSEKVGTRANAPSRAAVSVPVDAP